MTRIIDLWVRQREREREGEIKTFLWRSFNWNLKKRRNGLKTSKKNFGFFLMHEV